MEAIYSSAKIIDPANTVETALAQSLSAAGQCHTVDVLTRELSARISTAARGEVAGA